MEMTNTYSDDAPMDIKTLEEMRCLELVMKHFPSKNTYPDNTPSEVKIFEELRCLRCVMERLLTSLDPAGFTDYQMEKFSGSAESRQIARKYQEERGCNVHSTNTLTKSEKKEE
jgi:hypothetical protein